MMKKWCEKKVTAGNSALLRPFFMEAYFCRGMVPIQAETDADKNINLTAQVSGKKAKIMKNGEKEKIKLQIFNFCKIATQNKRFYKKKINLKLSIPSW